MTERPLGLEEISEHSVTTFKQIKEDATRTHGEDPTGQVGVFRGGVLIAIVLQAPGDGRAIAAMAHDSIVAFRADAIALMVDSYRCTIEPGTELPEWAQRRGGLAERWALGHHQGITEALSIMAMNADASIMTNVPYVRKGRKITWTEEPGDTHMEGMTGAIPDALRDAFTARPEFSAHSRGLAAVLAVDDDEYELRMDAMAIRWLHERGCVVAWLGQPEDKQRMEEYLNFRPEEGQHREA